MLGSIQKHEWATGSPVSHVVDNTYIQAVENKALLAYPGAPPNDRFS